LVIFGAFNTAASGQPIDLVCRETEYNKVKGPSEAAVVDLERRRISTPVGDFQISSVRIATFASFVGRFGTV
jgi:hypothetical protein